MGWSHFPFLHKIAETRPLLSANPPTEPGLMSTGIPYGSRLRLSGAKVRTVCIQKLSRCFCRAESAIICSIIITVKSSNDIIFTQGNS